MFKAMRYHDISCGHRVVGHEGKCRHLHGHNYRIHFTCVAPLTDILGRVIDFTVIKDKLCMWLENNWDHKFLAWREDKNLCEVYANFGADPLMAPSGEIGESFVFLPFNPTAENMAEYLVTVIGPLQLNGCGVVLESVTIEETAKCHASYTLEAK